MRTAVDHDFVLPEGRVTMDETRGRWPQGLAILLGIAAITAGITVFGTSKRGFRFQTATFAGVVLAVLAMAAPVFGSFGETSDAEPENSPAPQ